MASAEQSDLNAFLAQRQQYITQYFDASRSLDSHLLAASGTALGATLAFGHLESIATGGPLVVYAIAVSSLVAAVVCTILSIYLERGAAWSFREILETQYRENPQRWRETTLEKQTKCRKKQWIERLTQSGVGLFVLAMVALTILALW